MEDQTHYNALKRDTSLHHNQYIIKQVLGEPGGFGIAYLAIDTRLDKQVVIKEFLPDEIAYRDGDTVRAKTNTDKDNLEWGLDKFKEEAKVLAKFNHPNIVRVLNFFEDNDTAYFVMDYEEGEDLDIYLKRLGRDLTQGEIVSIIVPILDGLKEVHSYDFLHRDIKPGNIYIRSNGSPMLIDFGAARNAIGVKSKSITQILTPGYAPTEQYGSDVSKQGAFTDIYSIGAVLYKLVTNTTPIDAPDRSREVFEEENIDPLIPATQKANNSKYSKEFLEAIDWSLQIRAKNRPQNVVEFRDQLLGQCKLEEPEIKENPLTQLDEIIDMAGSDGIITKDEEMKILQKAKSLNIDENKAQEYLDWAINHYGWEKEDYKELNLSDYVKKLDRDLTQMEILNIVIPILDVLKQQHSLNIFHGNINPNNIIIKENHTTALTSIFKNVILIDKETIRILEYAPTEQYGSDVSKQGAFTDIYSIGAVLYKLVTNTTPIDAPDRSREVFEEENIDPLIPATQKANNSKYSKEFLEAIDWSLQIRAKDRPQNIIEFRDLLIGKSNINKQTKLKNSKNISITKENIIEYSDEILAWHDVETDLMWEIKTKENIDKTYSYEDAFEYTNNLNKKNYCGYNDWKIPSLKDLGTLFIFKKGVLFNSKDRYNNYCIKRQLSFNTNFSYWTSTNCKENSSKYFVVNFNSGSEFKGTYTNNYHIRCVRSVK